MHAATGTVKSADGYTHKGVNPLVSGRALCGGDSCRDILTKVLPTAKRSMLSSAHCLTQSDEGV